MEAILIYIAIIIILGYIGHLLKKRFPKSHDFIAGQEARQSDEQEQSEESGRSYTLDPFDIRNQFDSRVINNSWDDSTEENKHTIFPP